MKTKGFLPSDIVLNTYLCVNVSNSYFRTFLVVSSSFLNFFGGDLCIATFHIDLFDLSLIERSLRVMVSYFEGIP